MEPLAGFDSSANRGHYRPRGNVSAAQLADLMTHALRRARAEGLGEAVIDITAMTGFESPGPAYRRWLVRRWAEVAEDALRVAVVARAEHICPEKTGLLIAAEEGLGANICETTAEAIAWLDSTSRVMESAATTKPESIRN